METIQSSRVEILDSAETNQSQPLQIEPKGFANRYGLHPLICFFTLVLDTMLFGSEAMTLGASLPLSLIVSIAVGYATYKGQQAWYGDSADSAKTKAIILAILTFVPTHLPAFAYISLGFLGLLRKKS